MIKSWESSTDEVTFTELPKRKCTSEDFELIGEDKKRSAYGFY